MPPFSEKYQSLESSFKMKTMSIFLTNRSWRIVFFLFSCRFSSISIRSFLGFCNFCCNTVSLLRCQCSCFSFFLFKLNFFFIFSLCLFSFSSLFLLLLFKFFAFFIFLSLHENIILLLALLSNNFLSLCLVCEKVCVSP